MGRKAISGIPKTNKPLRIRLTDAERTAYDEAAARAGKPTATWARDILNTIVKRTNKPKAGAK
jgi:hypothetical protein